MTDSPRGAPGSPSQPAGRELSPQLIRFFTWIRSTGLSRGGDRWLAGVCGGIAERIGVEPIVVRVITILLAVLGAPVIFAYAVGWALLPNAEGTIHAEEALRGVFEPAMIAIIALLLLTFVPFSRGFWWQGPTIAWGLPDWLATLLAVGWSIALAIIVVWLIVFVVRRASATATDAATDAAADDEREAGYTAAAASAPSALDRDRSAQPAGDGSWRDHRPGAGYSSVVLGLALVVGAIAAGLYSAGTWSTAALVIGLACTLGGLAIGIIVSGIRGRDSGAMGGFAFLAAATLVVIGVFPEGTRFFPLGAPTWTVSPSRPAPGYVVLAGRPTIDLSRLETAEASDGDTIEVWLGFGVTDLVLPANRPVVVQANAIIGGVDYAGTANDDGGLFFHDTRTFNGGGSGAVTEIRVWSFFGQVENTGGE